MMAKATFRDISRATAEQKRQTQEYAQTEIARTLSYALALRRARQLSQEALILATQSAQNARKLPRMNYSITYEQAKSLFDAVIRVAEATPGVKFFAGSLPDERRICRSDGIEGNLMLWGERDQHLGAQRPARVTWESEASWVDLNDYSTDEAPRIVLNVDPEDLPTIRTEHRVHPPTEGPSE